MGVSSRGCGKAVLLLLVLVLFTEVFHETDALARRRGRRVRRGGAARVQARRGGRNRGRVAAQRRGRGQREVFDPRFNNLDGQVLINDPGLALGLNAGLQPDTFNGLNGVGGLGLDLNTISLLNGSNRIAFVRDRQGRQIPVELRDGAVVNGQLVNPSLDSINQSLLTGIGGNGIFSGAGQRGAFLPGTLDDIRFFNAGRMGSRGPAEALQPAGFAGGDQVIRPLLWV